MDATKNCVKKINIFDEEENLCATRSHKKKICRQEKGNVAAASVGTKSVCRSLKEV